MPIDIGIVGFDMRLEERIAAAIAAVGGPTKAASLLGRTRTHIDNMRKPGAVLRLEDLLPLAVAAGVSLDWMATGYQQRPDLQAAAGETAALVRLELLPAAAGRQPEPGFAVSPGWLQEALGLSPDSARTAMLDDAAMEPLLGAGAQVIVDLGQAPLRSGLYLVGLGDELVARRLNRMPDGAMVLVADADPGWRFVLDPEKLPAIFHRIVWSGRAH